MTKILDIFYKYSVVLDAILCTLICGSLKIYEIKYACYIINYEKYDKGLCSDLGAIGLTIGGFLLTISTILISFRTTALYDKTDLKNNSGAFKIFISSPLYFKTINLLNKSVMILVLLSLCNYLSKMILQVDQHYILFYLNICTTFVIMTTFSRCLYVLNLIVKMQH